MFTFYMFSFWGSMYPTQ